MKMHIVPHRNQLTIIESPARFKVVACGRRFGKTETGKILLADAAVVADHGVGGAGRLDCRHSGRLAISVRRRERAARCERQQGNLTHCMRFEMWFHNVFPSFISSLPIPVIKSSWTM